MVSDHSHSSECGWLYLRFLEAKKKLIRFRDTCEYDHCIDMTSQSQGFLMLNEIISSERYVTVNPRVGEIRFGPPPDCTISIR